MSSIGRPHSGRHTFCQQGTPEAFTQNLNEYFDETFVTDSKAIDDLATDYATDAARLQKQLAAIIAAPSKFLEVEKLKTEKEEQEFWTEHDSTENLDWSTARRGGASPGVHPARSPPSPSSR